jgi:hypothetical protein
MIVVQQPPPWMAQHVMPKEHLKPHCQYKPDNANRDSLHGGCQRPERGKRPNVETKQEDRRKRGNVMRA